MKNREVEQARVSLEEKAEQLSLISKYKSEFLANMSHELRTPLNSLLILAKTARREQRRNLTSKQVEYAKTIYASGGDLLALINEILDLVQGRGRARCRSSRARSALADLARVRRAQLPAGRRAERPRLRDHESTRALPTRIYTDPHRLQQVLKNLLSNAFKFTEQGRVSLLVSGGRARVSSFARDATPRVRERHRRSRSSTPASASRPRSKSSSSRPSNRPTAPPAANTAARASVCRSAARSARLLGGEIQVDSSPA